MTKNMTSKRGMIIMSILMPVLVALACVTLTDGGSPAEVVFGPGFFILTDTVTGLADLSSYKATLTLSFGGTKDGKTQHWSRNYVMLTTQEPAARQLTIEKTGDTSDPDPVLMTEKDGAAYQWDGENSCTATVMTQENSIARQLEPAGFLTGVIGADETGSETVNNIAADHYTFDERALGQSGVTQSTGGIWLASEGGYIVKYVLTTQGDADYFGEGIEGTLTWDYELTDVNQPLTIELTADCPAGMVDAPLLPDASDVLNMPSVLAYDTSTSLPEATAFYQEQIPSLGWTLIGEPTLSETTALMEFTQGDQTMTVIIIVGDTSMRVQIVLGKAETQE
jgi:hypothetical protein